MVFDIRFLLLFFIIFFPLDDLPKFAGRSIHIWLPEPHQCLQCLVNSAIGKSWIHSARVTVYLQESIFVFEIQATLKGENLILHQNLYYLLAARYIRHGENTLELSVLRRDPKCLK